MGNKEFFLKQNWKLKQLEKTMEFNTIKVLYYYF